MNALNTFMQNSEITQEAMDEIFDYITEMLYALIDAERMKQVYPTVFLYYYDYKEHNGKLKLQISVIENLAETAQGRAQQFFEMGKDFSKNELHIPACICFLTEAWKGLPGRNIPPSEQSDREEQVMLAGLSIYTKRAIRFFNIDRDEEGVLELSHDLTIDTTCDARLYLLEEFYQGYFSEMEPLCNGLPFVIH